jgi:hypothetical protein
MFLLDSIKINKMWCVIPDFEKDRMAISRDTSAKVDKAKFWAGVAVMAFYVLDCIAQNEIFQALERGAGNGTCPTNHTLGAAELVDENPLMSAVMPSPVLQRSHSDNGVTAKSGGCGHPKFDRPFFIVWWNHCFIAWIIVRTLVPHCGLLSLAPDFNHHSAVISLPDGCQPFLCAKKMLTGGGYAWVLWRTISTDPGFCVSGVSHANTTTATCASNNFCRVRGAQFSPMSRRNVHRFGSISYLSPRYRPILCISPAVLLPMTVKCTNASISVG